MTDYSKIGYDIIGASFAVRNNTGRGLLEKYYEGALAFELQNLGYKIERQVAIPALYQGQEIGEAYRADIIVDGKVIIEVKAILSMQGIERSQIYTYLKLSGLKLGYLINFGVEDFKVGNFFDEREAPFESGIYRIVNNI